MLNSLLLSGSDLIHHLGGKTVPDHDTKTELHLGPVVVATTLIRTLGKNERFEDEMELRIDSLGITLRKRVPVPEIS